MWRLIHHQWNNTPTVVEVLELVALGSEFERGREASV